jgi:hypothetical protein
MTVAPTTLGKPGLEVHARSGGTPIRRGAARIDENRRSTIVRALTVSREGKVRITVKRGTGRATRAGVAANTVGWCD